VEIGLHISKQVIGGIKIRNENCCEQKKIGNSCWVLFIINKSLFDILIYICNIFLFNIKQIVHKHNSTLNELCRIMTN